MNARWVLLTTFYLLLGLLGAWYLADTTSAGADLATYQRGGEALWTTGDPYASNADVPEDYRYRYPPLLAMVIPVLGWPPLWFSAHRLRDGRADGRRLPRVAGRPACCRSRCSSGHGASSC